MLRRSMLSKVIVFVFSTVLLLTAVEFQSASGQTLQSGEAILSASGFRTIPDRAKVRLQLADDTDINLRLRAIAIQALTRAGYAVVDADAAFTLRLESERLLKGRQTDLSIGSLRAGSSVGRPEGNAGGPRGDGVDLNLRVRPETLCRITEFSEHESNGRELDEGERVAVEVLPVLGQSAAAVEPGDGAFDHPTPGLDDEALHPIGSLDDLGLEIGQDAGQGAVKDRPLIGAIGEQFPEKGKQTEQGRQQRETAVAILNVGGGDDAVQQQALRIDQNMPLLALDQLAGIEAVAVDASPPFSALFTL